MFRKIYLHKSSQNQFICFHLMDVPFLIVKDFIKFQMMSWTLYHISIQNLYHMICLLNRYNLIGINYEKNHFPIRNYFNFTVRQFNWCHLLIWAKEFKFFVKRIKMIRLWSHLCFHVLIYSQNITDWVVCIFNVCYVLRQK